MTRYIACNFKSPNGDDQPVEELRAAANDVHVTVGDGVERARKNRDSRRLIRHDPGL